MSFKHKMHRDELASETPNEDNIFDIKDIDHNNIFKDNETDYNLPMAYQIHKDDSFTEETHFSLLKELEDKWTLIERNKSQMTKRKLNDNNNNDSVSLKTNSRSRLQDWKSVIEESKKKYQLQKRSTNSPNEDFSSFVKEKCEQLQKISHRENKTFDQIDYTNGNGQKTDKKSFLKPNNDVKVIGLRKSILYNQPMSDSKPKAMAINNDAIQLKSKKDENNSNKSHLTEKFKTVFCLITEDNEKKNDHKVKVRIVNNSKEKQSLVQSRTEAKNKERRVYTEANQQEWTFGALNRQFNEIITQFNIHNNTKTKKTDFTLNNTAINRKGNIPSVKDNTVTNPTNINTFRNQMQNIPKDTQKATQQPKMIKRINENKALLNELLPATKKPTTQNTNLHNYFTPHKSIAPSSNISSSQHHPHQNQHVYAKNNFYSTQSKLYSINSNALNKIINN